ncbi:MAG: thiamine pyrophosphate-dependent enzyme [Eggerthellaceae bacterium]
MSKALLMGNQAFAYAALEAGVNVVAGYPGTPSSEVVETVAKLHATGAATGVHVEWSTNEKAAMELLHGASLSGARTLFTCKQMGLNVASDALMSLNYVSVRGGFVVFVADDPGPISSQTEQDTRRFANFAKIPVFDPASPDQGYAMMKDAFELSERYHTPVILRATTRVCHASTFFDVPEHMQARPIPEGGFQRDPKWIIFPKRSFEAHGEINERLPKIAAEFDRSPYNPIEPCPVVGEGTVTKGIVAGGISASYAREALRMLNEEAARAGRPLTPYRFLQVGTPYPFPQERAMEFTQGLQEILVFEELDHVLEDALIQLAGSRHLPYNVKGKLDGSTLNRGENGTRDCLERIAAFLGASDLIPEVPFAQLPAVSGNTAPQVPQRPPVLCAGCPHRGSFYAVKRALRGRPNVMCGDIGCYTLGNAQPLDAIDTCLCMGAGITAAQGIATVEPGRKAVAFVGDSTFFASAMTGVANAVYNQHDATFIILDNATTAMTGSQPHPGTGQTLMGPKSTPIDIEAVLSALGVTCITRANPFFQEEAQQAARTAIDFDGPAAVIYEAPCTQLVKPDKAATVDAETCTGCSSCIRQIGCPAMAMDRDAGVMRIDPSLCYGCGLCTDICPFEAITAPVRVEGRVPYSNEPKTVATTALHAAGQGKEGRSC